jgi:hypothetical protein
MVCADVRRKQAPASPGLLKQEPVGVGWAAEFHQSVRLLTLSGREYGMPGATKAKPRAGGVFSVPESESGYQVWALYQSSTSFRTLSLARP